MPTTAHGDEPSVPGFVPNGEAGSPTQDQVTPHANGDQGRSRATNRNASSKTKKAAPRHAAKKKPKGRSNTRTQRVRTVMKRSGGNNGENGRNGKPAWWQASPLAVITLALTLSLNIGQLGFTYAHVLARLDANQLAITVVDQQSKDRDAAQVRLIEERHTRAMVVMDERYMLLTKNLERLESSLNAMMQLRTEVEVVKNKLTTIDDTLRRVERSWERIDNRNPLTPPTNMRPR